jgi:spore coat protein U-like protein
LKLTAPLPEIHAEALEDPQTIGLAGGWRVLNLGAMSAAIATNALLYNLYTDASHVSIWGDGSPGTSLMSFSGTSASYTVWTHPRRPECARRHLR